VQGAPIERRPETRTLWQRVHDHLRSAILANRLPPGSELNEVALAATLGVSRGPLREAIRQLAAEGLVTERPRHSAIVSALSREELVQAYQVREALEMVAVRLAVDRIEDTGIVRLRELTDDMEQAAERKDPAAFFDANARFHEFLVQSSGNQKLAEMHQQLAGQMRRYRMPSLAIRGSLHRSVGEHRAIIRAITARNTERATHLIGEHIRVPQRTLEAEPQTEPIVVRGPEPFEQTAIGFLGGGRPPATGRRLPRALGQS
jgi:DNA-binding GntR family transcriptional regulator